MSAKFNQGNYITLPSGKQVLTSKPYVQHGAMDEAEVQALAAKEEARQRKILEEQKGIQSSRLTNLAALLAEQQKHDFNQSIPGIAETAQSQGFLETSGFGNSLANKYESLTRDTSFELARQGLNDRDFEVSSLGEISKGTGDLNVAGLERRFSVNDRGRSEELSRELAKLGVVNPQGESSTDKNLRRAGDVVSIGTGIAQMSQGK